MSNLEFIDAGFSGFPHKIFNPNRLSILITLKIKEEEKKEAIRFHNLKHSLKLTDGNLASHLRTLEQEGYISTSSIIDGKRQKTFISITPKGLEVLNMFSYMMENILKVLAKE